MSNLLKRKLELRSKRRFRVRKKLIGTTQRPRLSVHKTNKHLSVQLIDDDKGATLASASTQSKDMKDKKLNRPVKESAKVLGEKIAGLAKDKGVNSVIFDRGYLKYHGVIAAIADAAREKGLQL